MLKGTTKVIRIDVTFARVERCCPSQKQWLVKEKADEFTEQSLLTLEERKLKELVKKELIGQLEGKVCFLWLH